MKRKHIVKRKGHSEDYDVRKLYASIYTACLAVQTDEKDAEDTADKVVKHVSKWLENKHEVTSRDIHRMAAQYLVNLNADAGFIYAKHEEMHL